MNYYVADTHALYWYLVNSPLLGHNASLAFDEADAGQALIYVPAIVLAELYYLNVKLGRPLDFGVTLAQLRHSRQFLLLPFYPSDTLEFDGCQSIPEMHDRMIAAVAWRLGIPCLTKDVAITNSGLIAVIW